MGDDAMGDDAMGADAMGADARGFVAFSAGDGSFIDAQPIIEQT